MDVLQYHGLWAGLRLPGGCCRIEALDRNMSRCRTVTGRRAKERKEMRKQNVDILLFVEHVARELDIACAIKYLLDKRHGISLEIASIHPTS